MLKLIILSAFLTVCQAADISDIYGTYTVVALYPNVPEHVCLKVSFHEDPRKVQCTCSDGTKSTLVEMKTSDELTAPNTPSHLIPPASVPILAVDKLDENVLVENITCDCAGQAYDYRPAVQVLSENYLLSVARGGEESSKHDLLVARNLPSAAELEALMKSTDELKKRSTASVICTKEIYEELRPKN